MGRAGMLAFLILKIVFRVHPPDARRAGRLCGGSDYGSLADDAKEEGGTRYEYGYFSAASAERDFRRQSVCNDCHRLYYGLRNIAFD